MVNCDKCGKKIGMLQAKHNYEDKNENNLIYCDSCHNKIITLEKEKERKEIKKLEEEKLKDTLKKNSKWEYKIITLNTQGSGLNATGHEIHIKYEEDLNKLGAEGWELVSITSMNSLAPRLGVGGISATEKVSCVFKRKL